MTRPFHNLLVLQHERCKADPAGELRRSYRFLGLDPDFTPPEPSRKVNARRHTLPSVGEMGRRAIAGYFRRDSEELAALLPKLNLGLWPEVAPERAAREAVR